MNREEVLSTLREYNKSLSLITSSKIERDIIKHVNETQYLYSFPFQIDVSESVEQFLKDNHYFKGLLKDKSEKLCFYLKYITHFTCNKNLIRMDVRSTNLSYYYTSVFHAITSFYLFYGLNLDLKKAIYGEYRQFPVHIDFSMIIAVELLNDNQEVIEYIKNVLTSENNVAVLTRDVIKAIEQSEDTELHDLLINVFLAARLQEGLRQSVIETVDEFNINLFYKIIEVIKEHNLLRYSSVQRGVLTWIGIGYEVVEDKLIYMIFDDLYQCIHSEEYRKMSLYDENPLKVYIALYTLGIRNVDDAILEAVSLLKHSKKHIVASALIYLKLTNHFDALKFFDEMTALKDDEWVNALYASECARIDYEKVKVNKKMISKLYDYFYNYASAMKTHQKYSSKGFEWFHIELYKQTFIVRLLSLIEQAPDQDRIDRFLPFVSSLYSTKVKLFMEKYFSYASDSCKKEFMLKEIISSNNDLSECVYKEYLKLSLNEETIVQLESRLKSKKSYARAYIVKIIANASKKDVLNSYQRLSSSSLKTMQEAAIELKQTVPDYFEKEERVEVKIIGKEEGFGLYKRKAIYPCTYKSHLTIKQKGFIKKQKVVDLGFLLSLSKSEVISYLKKWDERIKEHELEEYEIRGEYRQVKDRAFYPLKYGEQKLDNLPLSHIWKEYLDEDQLNKDKLFSIIFFLNSIDINFSSIMSEGITIDTLDNKDIESLTYYHHIELILRYYFYEKQDVLYENIYAFIELMNKYTRYKQYKQKDYYNNSVIYSIASLKVFSFFMSVLDFDKMDDETFVQCFPLIYETYIQFHLNCRDECISKYHIPMLSLARAVVLNIIPKQVLYEAILDTHTITIDRKGYYYRERSHRLFDAYRDAYFKGKGVYGQPELSLYGNHKAVSCLRETLDEIADVLIPMEASRINEKTEVTEYVKSLSVVRGLHHLIRSINVLDGEDLKRTHYGDDRNAVFTHLIKHCYLKDSDDLNVLKNHHVSEKRLVEIAMLAPQWIDTIDEILKWDGFKEACYYFIAHMKDYNYDEKKAEISNYTDIDPIDLNDGAFDITWCKNIYETLGEKRFSLIYNSAKFLCDNSFHTRARKYADAALLKTDKDTFLKQIKDTRNKDSLNAYCIVPIKDDEDLLERYHTVRSFLKESKQYGAQRQASEARCAEIAFMNLARNSRFETVTRLSWMMETETVLQYASLFNRQTIGDIEACLHVDENGKCEVQVYKNGKIQKSIPSKYKNDPLIVELKDVEKKLKEQYRRSKAMLEEAMENRVELTYEEITSIMKNPVISPMLQNLVLMSHNAFGFYKDGKLHGIDEVSEFDDHIRIVHPYDLYEAGEWHNYQKYIFDHKITQPFKQVFRELYLKLEDEYNQSYSKRYSGYQIQVQKTKGALKSRKWNVSYESGLEKVCYKDNIVANLYAEADWFSPSDIEAPSIDYVSFTSRKDHKNVLIKDINNILFSELMRDVDLAVSIGYVGGVDPITSFSTIELRKTIIEYTCQLMKLTNVSFSNHFVNIKGKINDYSIHLGSGNVQQNGGPAVHILPVHSQKRGKVYLPFLDEDPVTATILSKVILLAEDYKIKDPSILEQIVSKN